MAASSAKIFLLHTNSQPTSVRQAPILIAEDDANDVFLLRRAFQKAGMCQPVVVLRNGQEVVDYLAQQRPAAAHSDRNFPALMFLDLKMPLMDGFDAVSYTHLRAHETPDHLVCRLLL